ncbi:MAG TPA: hypothetical protein VHP11_14605, partial [Tepidisphaeraceae bacterium]|nr:hypothetical protein [Tepidisphaeraceae bacterium]
TKLELTQVEGKRLGETHRLFDVAARQAKLGEVCGPLKFKNDALFCVFHKKEPGELLPLEKVRDSVVTQVQRARSQKRWLEKLSSSAVGQTPTAGGRDSGRAERALG